MEVERECFRLDGGLVRFRQLVEMMVEADLKNVREGAGTTAGCARPD